MKPYIICHMLSSVDGKSTVTLLDSSHAAELRRRHTNDTPEHLSEMAPARVAHVECDLIRLRDVSRMSCCARVTRSRVTKRSGDMPVDCLKIREKWKGLS